MEATMTPSVSRLPEHVRQIIRELPRNYTFAKVPVRDTLKLWTGDRLMDEFATTFIEAFALSKIDADDISIVASHCRNTRRLVALGVLRSPGRDSYEFFFKMGEIPLSPSIAALDILSGRIEPMKGAPAATLRRGLQIFRELDGFESMAYGLVQKDIQNERKRITEQVKRISDRVDALIEERGGFSKLFPTVDPTPTGSEATNG